MSDKGEPHFFNPHQRATVAAAMARIIPTDDSPGATEAGWVEFVDRYLSGVGFIYAKPDGSGFETLTGPIERGWRQRIEILRRKYSGGIEALDRAARSQSNVDFVELDASRRDEVLKALESAGAQPAAAGGPPGEGPALQQTSTETDIEFLPLLVMHTRQGFYCDPIYGGNEGRVGWDFIGFPGPKSLMEVHAGRFSALP